MSVLPAATGPLYASVADVQALAALIPDSQANSAQPGQITSALQTASRVVDDFLGAGSGLLQQQLMTVTVSDVRKPLVKLPRPFTLTMPPASPPSLTVPSPAAAYCAYQIVAINALGEARPSPVGYTQSGPALLAPATPVNLSWTPATDASRYRIIRVAPGQMGSIGTTSGLTFSDTGQLADTTWTPAPQDPLLENAAVTVNGRALATASYIVEDWGLRLYIPGFLDADGFPIRSASPLTFARRQPEAPYGSQVLVTGLFGYPLVPEAVHRATTLLANDVLNFEPLPDGSIGELSVEGYRYARLRSTRETPDEMLARLNTTGNIVADRLLRPYKRDLVLVG